MKYTRLAMVIALGIGFTGCGSSGGGDTSSNSNPNNSGDTPTVTKTTISGTAVDGYISGATVCLDINSNDTCDTDEPSTTTNTDGTYTIDVASIGTYPIIMQGGTDTATNESFVGTLKEMVVLDENTTTLSAKITPLTTVATNIYKENVKLYTNYKPSDAKQKLATNLGLTLYQVDADPMQDTELFTKTQIVVQSTQLLAASLDTNSASAFDHVMKQLSITLDESTEYDLVISKVIQQLESSTYNAVAVSISSDTEDYVKQHKEQIVLKTENITDTSTLSTLQKNIDTYTKEATAKIGSGDTSTLDNTIDALTNDKSTADNPVTEPVIPPVVVDDEEDTTEPVIPIVEDEEDNPGTFTGLESLTPPQVPTL